MRFLHFQMQINGILEIFLTREICGYVFCRMKTIISIESYLLLNQFFKFIFWISASTDRIWTVHLHFKHNSKLIFFDFCLLLSQKVKFNQNGIKGHSSALILYNHSLLYIHNLKGCANYWWAEEENKWLFWTVVFQRPRVRQRY